MITASGRSCPVSKTGQAAAVLSRPPSRSSPIHASTPAKLPGEWTVILSERPGIVPSTAAIVRAQRPPPTTDIFITIALESVENQDSAWRLGVIQAFDGKIRFDGRPMGEDGASLFG